jgi:hypothetical protein
MLPRPKIRGTQVGLQRPAQVDSIKAAMRAGTFNYAASVISGFVDPRGVYHIYEGHHRMVAALELERETGDSMYVLNLLIAGAWTDWPRAPLDSRPMPARTWWGWFRNRLGY